jgi:hypothetical protein
MVILNEFEEADIGYVDLPDVVNIETYGFRNCSTMTGAEFTNALYIESYAFQNCTSLSYISAPQV